MREVGEMGSVQIDRGRRLLKNIVLQHRDECRSSTSKRSRETEAEAVAFVVCNAIGLETGTAAQDNIQFNYTTLMPSS